MRRHCLKARRRDLRRRKSKTKGGPNLGPPIARSYHTRKKALTQLGYDNYSDYLKSDLWAQIKERIIADNPCCIRCGALADQVHHAFYSVAILRGEEDTKLYSICQDCHRRAEYATNGTKATLGRANRFLGIIDSKGNWTEKRNLPTHAGRKSLLSGQQPTDDGIEGE